MNDRPLISHIGIAVKDLDTAIAAYENILGCRPASVTEVTDQKVRVALFSSSSKQDYAAGGRIELLAPTDKSSPIDRFIEKRGEGLHHVSVYVDDLDSKLAELKSAGVRLIDESPRLGADGNRIAFVHPLAANSVLIELEERPG